MELRLLLAIVLSFLLFFVYQVLFVKKTEVHEIAPAEKKVATEKEVSTEKERVRVLEDTPAEEKSVVSPAIGPDRTITVTTDQYVATISEKAAAFKSFKLRHYREAVEPSAPMKELIELPEDRERYTPVVSFLEKGGKPAQRKRLPDIHPTRGCRCFPRNKNIRFYVDISRRDHHCQNVYLRS